MFFHKPKYTGDLGALKIRVWNSMLKKGRKRAQEERRYMPIYIYTYMCMYRCMYVHTYIPMARMSKLRRREVGWYLRSSKVRVVWHDAASVAGPNLDNWLRALLLCVPLPP